VGDLGTLDKKGQQMTDLPYQYDLFGAVVGERDKLLGQALVADNNLDWLADAVHFLDLYLPYDTDFMGEYFRRLLVPLIGYPKGNGTWGMLTSMILRKHPRLIYGTGRYFKSSSAINHGHKYEIYRRCRYGKPN
jgi:hypothetical protein